MSIKKLTINGLRGFSDETNIHFAIPDNVTPGSGLTILVGPNNSGKSTIIEAIHLLNSSNDIIPISSRNVKNNGKIKIETEDLNGNVRTIESTDNNGAFVQKKYNNEEIDYWSDNMNTFILSSKRAFASTFHNNNYQNRENYKGNVSDSDYRSENNLNNNFGGRLLTIYKNRENFDNCLKKVISPIPKWTIEASNSNNLYLEFSFDKIKHSSKGAGDGYINIFNIVDSLYDSTENNVILIDEPEISLHPDLQRKLFNLLVEYSKDKQIIVSTHSPYFVDWSLFSEKTKIIRLKKDIDSIKLFELSENTKKDISKILNDYQKPHILSLNANEIFFLNDNVILTEGQDDVLCYRELFKKVNYSSTASFFGWGAGGATKMRYILNILKDLGYNNVFIILDNDQKEEIPNLQEEYPNYYFFPIAADDVRNKKRDKKIDDIIKYIEKIEFDDDIKNDILNTINSKFTNKVGLVKDMKKFEINPEYEENFSLLIDKLKKYFENNKQLSEINYEKNTIDASLLENEQKAHKLLEEWLNKNKLFEYTKNKYKKIQFQGGGGGPLSFKDIGNGKYYVIISQSDSLSQDYSVTINFHIIIDINKNKVKLKKRQIISNTLPISKVTKIIEKIFN